MKQLIIDDESGGADGIYVITGNSIPLLSEMDIARYYAAPGFETLGNAKLVAVDLHVDAAAFNGLLGAFPLVTVTQQGNKIILTCPCGNVAGKLCSHQAEVLLQIKKKEAYRVFFDRWLRYLKIRTVALDYGLENEHDLDALFSVNYEDKKIIIEPRLTSLFPVTKDSLNTAAQLLCPVELPTAPGKGTIEETKRILVLKQHKYYKHLQVELYDAAVTKGSNIKNPLMPVSPLGQVWESNDPLELKFFTAVSRFQQNIDDSASASTLNSLKAIVRNPLGLDCFIHDGAVSEKVTAPALQQVSLNRLKRDIEITVNTAGNFYELSGLLTIDDVPHSLNDIELIFDYFIRLNKALYLVKDLSMHGVLRFFKARPGPLLIHQTKFAAFKTQVLNKLEEKTVVSYPYIKLATPVQLEQNGFNATHEKIIYLSDFGQYVMIIPTMTYGETEIPVLNKTQIYAVDDKGASFLVKRQMDEELKFIALLLKQHEHFEEQLDNDLQYFYLHKKRFLDESWFLNAFEIWQQQGITILGFNEISNNKLNPNKVNINIKVLSGLNWFNTVIKVKFGKQRGSLKHLHKAIRNKTKYVQLDDGTLGILPDEWIEKFKKFFIAGEVIDEETLQIPKVGFETVDELFEAAMLDWPVKQEIEIYKKQLSSFENIKEVNIPPEFLGTLRPYQQQGLNWLNFLDDFNFGGCLADDMGLGKTIQIIAFILLQRSKSAHNTNLLVVPTSLLFNWQAEVKKFAPSIKMHTIYGAGRIKGVDEFDQYEIVLTSYGTLLADVGFLRHYQFNYIFLDESQNIKNPDSQRYKAVCLLKSRNRIAITGTPIENNSFDIYGQLSFACPGLLGNKRYFKEIYAMPIDQFNVSKRARELQKKISPFILRRTKDQVAKELPEKTEMILYCAMQPGQRTIYDAYEKEFKEFISATTQELIKNKPMHVLKGITKLRQICDSPLLLQGERVPGNTSAKIDMLIEQVETKSPKHKILVFSQFVAMLELIKKELASRGIKHAYLTGATRDRETVVSEFQNNPEIRVFLISLKAGGTGLNLTAADYIYLVDPWWNPAIENQAIDRSYRIGQQKNVIAVRLICPDTIEDKMMQLQENKKGVANKLIQTDASIFKSLSKDDLLGMLTR